ncbi:right-handed parallel beta-helix repeat-containing protein [Riemerella columbina]|uniref:right-handed parallel beta-helix repeat-containing protein n=1 Tax=Riemerella columbina TaxID=103810 RepID=UPI0026703BED|nr:right-handed parallel beta-helix repeat-containing protein [Riemerella columbina]WKS94935.1 right-handed parallel beta-helix repeat-containing protein [Riemerella columbina]
MYIKKVFKIVLAITLVFLFFSCKKAKAQAGIYKELPKEASKKLKSYNESVKYNQLQSQIKFKKAEDYLPKPYVKDATIDYTIYIQRALDENTNILMPNFPILVNDQGLTVYDNQKILFGKYSLLRLLPSSKTNYEILRIHNRKNVDIYFPKIYGDRDTHLSNKGEWGMGISIKSSENVKIINPYISHCWGDGIYIGQIGTKDNINIEVRNGWIDYNRRNGISVINSQELLISDVVVSNTFGTNPQAGIDIEPNHSYNIIKNIKIQNSYLYNNKNYGVSLAFYELMGSEDSVGVAIRTNTIIDSKVGIGYATSKIPKNKKYLKGNVSLYKNKFDTVDDKYKVEYRSKYDRVNIKNNK